MARGTCTPLTQAPSDAHIDAWAAHLAGAAPRARAPRSSMAPSDTAPDDTYVTEVDADEPRARAPEGGTRTNRVPRRPAARPATERAPRAPPASSVSSRTQAPRSHHGPAAPPTRQRVPPAVLKRRTVRNIDLHRPLQTTLSIPCRSSTAKAIRYVGSTDHRSSAFSSSTLFWPSWPPVRRAYGVRACY